MKKRIISVMLCMVMCVCVIQPVSATTASEAQQNKQKAQSELDDVNNAINGLENNMNSVQGEIDDVTGQLSQVMAQIGALETKMEIKEAEIYEAQESLEAAEEKQEEQYESMKVRIRYMYENGTQSYLALLLESKSISELINRVEYISSVYNYDRDLLDEYEETTRQVAELKSGLEQEMDEMVALQDDYEAQQSELESLKSELKAKYSDYETKLAKAESEAEKLQSEIEKQNQIIAQRQREEEERRNNANNNTNNNSNSNSGSSNSSGSSGNDSDGNTGDDSNEDPEYSTDISGSSVASYAQGFVGYPYVWGATGPNSFDCSGFVYYVYGKHFGVSGMTSRLTAAGYSRVGKEVSYKNAKPGDLVFYASGGYVHHVAIYIGGGRIVHAKGKNYGVVTDNATYHDIYCIRRVL